MSREINVFFTIVYEKLTFGAIYYGLQFNIQWRYSCVHKYVLIDSPAQFTGLRAQLLSYSVLSVYYQCTVYYQSPTQIKTHLFHSVWLQKMWNSCTGAVPNTCSLEQEWNKGTKEDGKQRWVCRHEINSVGLTNRLGLPIPRVQNCT